MKRFLIFSYSYFNKMTREFQHNLSSIKRIAVRSVKRRVPEMYPPTSRVFCYQSCDCFALRKLNMKMEWRSPVKWKRRGELPEWVTEQRRKLKNSLQSTCRKSGAWMIEICTGEALCDVVEFHRMLINFEISVKSEFTFGSFCVQMKLTKKEYIIRIIQLLKSKLMTPVGCISVWVVSGL